MKPITFVTGNQKKADFLAAYLGHPVEHRKVDLDEIQSMSLREIVEHKARGAYEILKEPVLVEDSFLEFTALGGLPGPFIKWFELSLPYQAICDLLAGKDRAATARCGMGYYDGKEFTYFESALPGRIAESPSGSGGYGFDVIYIPDGYDVTRAALSAEDEKKTHLMIKPFEKVKAFLAERA